MILLGNGSIYQSANLDGAILQTGSICHLVQETVVAKQSAATKTQRTMKVVGLRPVLKVNVIGDKGDIACLVLGVITKKSYQFLASLDLDGLASIAIVVTDGVGTVFCSILNIGRHHHHSTIATQCHRDNQVFAWLQVIAISIVVIGIIKPKVVTGIKRVMLTRKGNLCNEVC